MYAIEEKIENERLFHALKTENFHKKELGQYFTPYAIANFMASLFPVLYEEPISLLDPGAGIGVLSCAFLNRISKEKWNNKSVSVSVYETDPAVIKNLSENLGDEKVNFKDFYYSIFNTDFLAKTSFEYSFNQHEKYSHIIMNPPYKKILTKSPSRTYARLFGLETVNMYSAFVGASIAQLKENGYLVAIIPRSFCNGVYYKSFREFILQNCAIKHIHLFESRKEAFKDESVLQENIIIMLQKTNIQNDVVITYSKDSELSNIIRKTYPFEQIVSSSDSEKYIKIPTPDIDSFITSNSNFVTLNECGISVSTGTIVDFRVKSYLRKIPDKNTVPLFYPIHFRNYKLDWPKESKKSNAILWTKETEQMFAPDGNYVVVKRFSTKEENKRLVASLVTSNTLGVEAVAFENHLNVFHISKNGLPKDIAYGLVVWLNTTFLDRQFRLFSGHTQVNATDLRKLPFPKRELIIEMGKLLQNYGVWSQNLFDSISEEVLNEKPSAVNF